MATSSRADKIVGLFNCDNLYDLNIVETLLRQVETDLHFTLSVRHHVFRLPEMKKLSGEVPEMDYAVFVVHANESRLSINEKDAGIGYAKLFTALKEKTGDKVLVVIGGDNYYKGEENQVVLSNWAKYKISSQFSQEYLDGRKSFVFSWYKKPNPIHYPALKHFFNNQGQVFEVPRELIDQEKRLLEEKELEKRLQEQNKLTKQFQEEKEKRFQEQKELEKRFQEQKELEKQRTADEPFEMVYQSDDKPSVEPEKIELDPTRESTNQNCQHPLHGVEDQPKELEKQHQENKIKMHEDQSRHEDQEKKSRYIGFMKRGDIVMELSWNPRSWKPSNMIIEDLKEEMKNEEASLIEVISTKVDQSSTVNKFKYIQHESLTKVYNKERHDSRSCEDGRSIKDCNYERPSSWNKWMNKPPVPPDSTLVHQSFWSKGREIVVKAFDENYAKLPGVILDDMSYHLPEQITDVYYLEVFESKDKMQLHTKVYKPTN